VLRKTFAPFAVRKIFLTAKYAKVDTQRAQRQNHTKCLLMPLCFAPFAKNLCALCGEKNSACSSPLFINGILIIRICINFFDRLLRYWVFCSLCLVLAWLARQTRQSSRAYKKDGRHGS
jgi:hypothetical protein